MENEKYFKREISAEFSFSADEEIKVIARSEIKPGSLTDVVTKAVSLFLAAAAQMEMPVDPEVPCDVHMTLRYWHIENSLDMIQEVFEVSCFEVVKPGQMEDACRKLSDLVVTRFMEVLFGQHVDLPGEVG